MVTPIENPIQNAPSVHRRVTLHKEVDFVKHLSVQGNNSKVPFTPHLKKNQRKKWNET